MLHQTIPTGYETNPDVTENVNYINDYNVTGVMNNRGPEVRLTIHFIFEYILCFAGFVYVARTKTALKATAFKYFLCFRGSCFFVPCQPSLVHNTNEL